jgi:hypothetical protein
MVTLDGAAAGAAVGAAAGCAGAAVGAAGVAGPQAASAAPALSSRPVDSKWRRENVLAMSNSSLVRVFRERDATDQSRACQRGFSQCQIHFLVRRNATGEMN